MLIFVNRKTHYCRGTISLEFSYFICLKIIYLLNNRSHHITKLCLWLELYFHLRILRFAFIILWIDSFKCRWWTWWHWSGVVTSRCWEVYPCKPSGLGLMKNNIGTFNLLILPVIFSCSVVFLLQGITWRGNNSTVIKPRLEFKNLTKSY